MNDFPYENILQIRKPPLEREFFERLQQGKVTFPPTHLRLVQEQSFWTPDQRYDGIIEVTWADKQAHYLFDYKSANSPRILEDTMNRMAHYANTEERLPLLILPYLSEESLYTLDNRQISGIDLCGNGILLAPNFRLWRSGQPNQFKQSRPIRNPFQGDSSIFARCFLLRERFSSLGELQQFAHERTFSRYPAMKPSGLAQGTASKVVHTLMEELTVQKEGAGLRLIDSRHLLTLLRRGQRPQERPTLVGSTSFPFEQVWERLQEERYHGSLRAVATGITSASRYRLLSGADRLSLYVDDLTVASAVLNIRAGKAFANIQLFEDRKNVVYFDSRADGAALWASPIQTWLELIAGGPREQEAAEAIEDSLAHNQGDALL